MPILMKIIIMLKKFEGIQDRKEEKKWLILKKTKN